MTSKDYIQQALDDNAAAIAKLYATPRPDSSIDGRSDSWTAMRKSLLDERQQLMILLQNEDGPFEAITYGV
jgi:hypothetical protein